MLAPYKCRTKPYSLCSKIYSHTLNYGMPSVTQQAAPQTWPEIKHLWKGVRMPHCLPGQWARALWGSSWCQIHNSGSVSWHACSVHINAAHSRGMISDSGWVKTSRLRGMTWLLLLQCHTMLKTYPMVCPLDLLWLVTVRG